MSNDTFNIHIKYNITGDKITFTGTCKKDSKSKLITKSSSKLNVVFNNIFNSLNLDDDEYNINYDNCIIDVIIKNKDLEVIDIYPHNFIFGSCFNISNPTTVYISGNIYNCNNVEFVKAYNEFIKNCKEYAEKYKMRLFTKKKLNVKMKTYSNEIDDDMMMDGGCNYDSNW